MVVPLPVFTTSTVQVAPPSVVLSILYPVIAEPPLSVGGAQLKLICDEDTAVAVSPVGGDGATASVVADAVLEGELIPTELMAETRSEEDTSGIQPAWKHVCRLLLEKDTIVDQ